MSNVKECLKILQIEFKEISPFDLEIETVLGNEEWGRKHEILAAILTILRNPEVFEDAILFSQVVLGINGIAADFAEFEFPTPEMIALFFKTCLELEKLYESNFKTLPLDDDVVNFICVACAEDGLFFLENELKSFQNNLIDLLRDVYSVEISQDSIKECENLWKKYYNFPLEGVPEDSSELIQVNKNYVIRDYINDIFEKSN